MTMSPTNLLLADLASSGLEKLPPKYIRPISDRPNLAGIQFSDDSIPLIDLQHLNGPNRRLVVESISKACQRDGFFQVKNHGIPEELINGIVSTAREFFKLPESERLKCYSDDPTKTTRLSTSFNVKTEKVASWRDFLRLHCYPLEDYIQDWPSNPPHFRKIVSEYCTSMRALVLQLVEAISESLGLEKDCINHSLGKHAQHMAMNYYPPCPQPDLTFGLPGHTDVGLITVLLQDQFPGLQVLRAHKWVAVNPFPNTFIVNIADQMEVISNGRYKSVLHRVVVNSEEERISIPTFYCPSADAIVEPAPGLVDDEHPALYRNFSYGEYYEKFWNKGLDQESCLDLFKTNLSS